jgi:hypothetical protein
MSQRKHPFPFRTRKLSFAEPMVLIGQLIGRVGRRQGLFVFYRVFVLIIKNVTSIREIMVCSLFVVVYLISSSLAIDKKIIL